MVCKGDTDINHATIHKGDTHITHDINAEFEVFIYTTIKNT